MRAVVLRRFGPPEVLALEQVSDPEPGAGEVLVDVALAGVTFVETQVRAGRPPSPAMAPALPAVPGNGVAGTVAAVGPGVGGDLLGRRVVTTTGGTGGYAERAVVPADGLVAVPAEVDLADALAVLADGRTALLLTRTVRPRPGEVVVVTAAGGGVGTLLVQLAGGAGARVVATAGDARKRALARDLGAEVAVDHRDPGWADQVRAQPGRGVAVALDGVGGAVGRQAWELVGPGGRFLSFGMASGSFTEIAPGEAGEREVEVLRMAPPTPAESAELSRAAVEEVRAGRLRPVVGQLVPLAEAARAHAAIEDRSALGKTLLLVGGRSS